MMVSQDGAGQGGMLSPQMDVSPHSHQHLFSFVPRVFCFAVPLKLSKEFWSRLCWETAGFFFFNFLVKYKIYAKKFTYNKYAGH